MLADDVADLRRYANLLSIETEGGVGPMPARLREIAKSLEILSGAVTRDRAELADRLRHEYWAVAMVTRREAADLVESDGVQIHRLSKELTRAQTLIDWVGNWERRGHHDLMWSDLAMQLSTYRLYGILVSRPS